jgi:hypothetical protein
MYYPIEKQGYGMVGYMHYSSQSISLSIVICATSTKPILGDTRWDQASKRGRERW